MTGQRPYHGSLRLCPVSAHTTLPHMHALTHNVHTHTHTQDMMVLKMVTGILDYRVYDGPLHSMREVSPLVVVLFQKKFPKETDLVTQFQEIV